VRVGIEARLAVSPAEHTGFEFYLHGLVRGLAALAPDDEVFLYFKPGPGIRDDALPRAKCLRPRPIALRAGWLTLGLPWAVWRDGVRAMLFPYAVLPRFLTAPAVVTFHDLTFESNPEWYTDAQLHNALGPHRDALRRAAHFIVPSQSTKADMQRLFGTAPERIIVIPHGTPAHCRPDPGGAQRLRARLALPERYILTVGAIQPRKNLETLVTAVAQARTGGDDLHLVIAGPRGWKNEAVFACIEALGVGAAVHFPGYIGEDDLSGLYTGAVALAFPSWYEGFGLPVLEAMACGCPVVCSDRGSLPEVAGDAAWLLPPDQPERWTEALRTLWHDDDRRRALREAGLRRAAQFSWVETARRTLEVLRTVAEGN